MAVLLVAKANPRHIALVTGLALFSAVLVVATGPLQSYQFAAPDDLRRHQPGQQQPDDQGADPAVAAVAAAIATGELTGQGFMHGR